MILVRNAENLTQELGGARKVDGRSSLQIASTEFNLCGAFVRQGDFTASEKLSGPVRLRGMARARGAFSEQIMKLGGNHGFVASRKLTS